MNKDNAEAPASIQSGTIISYSGGLTGKTTITGPNTFTTTQNDGTFYGGGTFTYSASGFSATVVATYSNGLPSVTQVYSNFKVVNGEYTGATVTQTGGVVGAVTFSGSKTPYTAAPVASASNPIKAGVTYTITKREGNDPEPAPIGSLVSIVTVGDSTITIKGPDGSSETFTRQSDGSYLFVDSNGWRTVITSNSDGSVITALSSGTNNGVGVTETYTCTRN